jgi:predicted Rossmann fold flavoprotein
MNHYDVIVIGGGASGMMAAGEAGRHCSRVLLIEKNSVLGKKLSISGGGRCNIMNARFDIRELAAQYGDAAKFLYSSFSRFGPQETWDYFHHNGLPLYVEENNRAFPVSQKAHDVVRFLESIMTAHGVTVMTDCAITSFEHNDKEVTGIVTTKGRFTADRYILATGGSSHPETGSTGDGFRFLRDLGHTVVAPNPTLVPLLSNSTYCSYLSGVSLDAIKITFHVDGVPAHSEKGRMLFTHTGVSGPMILNTSKKVSDIVPIGTVVMNIDMFPSLDLGTLDRSLVQLFDLHKNKLLKNVLPEYVQSPKIADVVIDYSGIDPHTPVHSISRDQRKSLLRIMKAFPMTITGLAGMDKAIVADGGVVLSEIDMKTFRSNIVTNLSITGDLLHINRPSGGFSLQLCWTSGFLAGSTL